MKFQCVSGGLFSISLYIKMATPTQILAENAQRPPAEWLPEYLRALANMEELAYYKREAAKMRAFLDLMDRFEGAVALDLLDQDMFFEPPPPPVEAMHRELLNTREDVRMGNAAFACDCGFCTETTARSFQDRMLHSSVAHNLRVVADSVCRRVCTRRGFNPKS